MTSITNSTGVEHMATDTQFTPGPWSMGPWIDSAGGHVYRVITHEGRKVSAISVYGHRADGSVGGRALKFGGHTKTVSAEECDANARLIAKAPDLLALVKSLAETIPANCTYERLRIDAAELLAEIEQVSA